MGLLIKYKYRIFTIIFLTLIVFIFIAFAKKISDIKLNVEKTGTGNIAKKPPPPVKLYGIVIDTLLVIEGKIKLNEHLSQILSRYNISNETIDRMAKLSKDVFDVRKMIAGHNYSVFCAKDISQTAKYFIYEANSVDYVVYKMHDSISVYVEHKKVDTIKRYASGIINSSLYETMMDNGLSPVLTNELSEIFAWQIDFFRLQKGDKFKIIYEEMQIEGEPIGIGDIPGAYFSHFDEDYYAVYFEEDGKKGYYDEEANSLQKVLLKAPLKYSRITSRYSTKKI